MVQKRRWKACTPRRQLAMSSRQLATTSLSSTAFVGRLLASLLLFTGFIWWCLRCRRQRQQQRTAPSAAALRAVRRRKASKVPARPTASGEWEEDELDLLDDNDDAVDDKDDDRSWLTCCLPRPCFASCIRRACGVGLCALALRCYCRGVRCAWYAGIVLLGLALAGAILRITQLEVALNGVGGPRNAPSNDPVAMWQAIYNQHVRGGGGGGR